MLKRSYENCGQKMSQVICFSLKNVFQNTEFFKNLTLIDIFEYFEFLNIKVVVFWTVILQVLVDRYRILSRVSG